MEFSHPDIYRSLTQLLEADKDTVESMSLTFSTTLTSMFGENIEYDLVKDGKNRAVTQQNKFYFVEVYADFLLNKSIKNSVRYYCNNNEWLIQNSLKRFYAYHIYREMSIHSFCESQILRFRPIVGSFLGHSDTIVTLYGNLKSENYDENF